MVRKRQVCAKAIGLNFPVLSIIWKNPRVGPLQDPVTWYKIKYTGEQVAQWDFQNNAPAFVLEVPLLHLLTSIFNFVPCDRVVQRAYCWVLCIVTFSNISML